MSTSRTVVIIDYGMGNLYSVQQACKKVGLTATISPRASDMADVSGVILPGVGAFGTAMDRLRVQEMVAPLRSFAASGRPLLGICLGMQLLMDSSEEFGAHEGLGLIRGNVTRFMQRPGTDTAKVPQIQWNRVRMKTGSRLFKGVTDNSFMYFLHSYCVRPGDQAVVSGTTEYCGAEYCSALECGNIMATQFHPEKSMAQGLQIFSNFKDIIHS